MSTPVSASSVDRCQAIAKLGNGPTRVAFRLAALKPNEVSLTFVGHATFLIESPGGIKIATDYNDYVRPRVVPDIITMNHAHSSHYTERVDPLIKHVLRGWNSAATGGARHDLELGDVRVRNVATNIRDWGGGTELYGNSIFIFEIAGFCIGHLGHLHHTLTPEHLAQIGQLDVVMVPVDGSYTMDVPGMIQVIKDLHARVIIPMHYFGPSTLARFLEKIRSEFEIRELAVSQIILNRAALPGAPQVLVLPGG